MWGLSFSRGALSEERAGSAGVLFYADSLRHLLCVFPWPSRRLRRASAAHHVKARCLGGEAGTPTDCADLDGGHVYRYLHAPNTAGATDQKQRTQKKQQQKSTPQKQNKNKPGITGKEWEGVREGGENEHYSIISHCMVGGGNMASVRSHSVFFSSLIPSIHIIFTPFISPSPSKDVTQVWGHEAESSPPSPPRYVLSFISREYSTHSSSTCAYPRYKSLSAGGVSVK